MNYYNKKAYKWRDFMKIKLISINPVILNHTESKLIKLEEQTNDNIKKLHNTIDEYNDDINTALFFGENEDKDITRYIEALKNEREKYKVYEKNAIKELKKIQKRKKYIDFIKKINN